MTGAIVYYYGGNIVERLSIYDENGNIIEEEQWYMDGTQKSMVKPVPGGGSITASWDEDGNIQNYLKRYESGNVAARIYYDNFNRSQFQSYWDSQEFTNLNQTGSNWQYRLHYTFNTYTCHGEDRTRYAFNESNDNRCPQATKDHYHEYLGYRTATTGGSSYDIPHDSNFDRNPGIVRPAQPLPESSQYSPGNELPQMNSVAGQQSQQPSFAADQTLISNIKEYATETWRNDPEHVDRWHRVLKTLGVEEFPGLTTMTSTEAYTYVQQGWNRWIPVVAELKSFEAWQQQQPPQQPQQQPPQPPQQQPPQQPQQQPPQPPQQQPPQQPQQQDGFTADQTLISNIKEYAAETWRGQEHVDRWHRVLKTLGVEEFPSLTTMTSEEAYTYVQQGWNRWIPVVAELKLFETWQQQQQPPQLEPEAQDPTSEVQEPTPETQDPTPTDLPESLTATPLYQAIQSALDNIPQSSPLYPLFQSALDYVINSHTDDTELTDTTPVPPTPTPTPQSPTPAPLPTPTPPHVSPDEPLTLSVSDAYAVEGDSLAFGLVLNKPSAVAIDVYYITIDWTATTSDYEFSSDMVTFSPGQTLMTVLVPTIADAVAEDPEKMMFEITIADGAKIGNYAGAGIIFDKTAN